MVFPGLGLGVVYAGILRVTDAMMLAAARAVADLVEKEHLDQGLVVPPIPQIRNVAVHVAAAVVKLAVADGTTRRPNIPKDETELHADIKRFMYAPNENTSKL